MKEEHQSLNQFPRMTSLIKVAFFVRNQNDDDDGNFVLHYSLHLFLCLLFYPFFILVLIYSQSLQRKK